MAKRTLAAALAAGLLLVAGPSWGARVKDIASIRDVRENQLIGYGLVVGLNRTGDGNDPTFTPQSLSNMLKKLGVKIDPTAFRTKNVAAVMVTANLPPFARKGMKVDIVVSTIGDSSSLLGGTLILTPLRGADGKVYAVAQGPVSLGGGFAFSGATGTRVERGHPTSGTISGGAIIEREVPLDFAGRSSIRLALHYADFTTALRVAKAINDLFGKPLATPRDPRTLDVRVPPDHPGGAVALLGQIERLEVTPDTRAQVVVNERTGTVVVGDNVRISTVAVGHGNISLVIREESLVSQPRAFAPPSAETVVVPQTEITVRPEQRQVVLMPQAVSIGDVVRGLNALGVSPRDLIAILQAIKAAGALHAELVIQ